MLLMEGKVLITGGAGFLGSNLALHLAEKGMSVAIADNFSRRGAEDNLKDIQRRFPDIVSYSLEVSDMPALIARERPGIIYHFAAQVAVTTSVASPISDFRINAEGTFNIARTAGEYGVPLIYASTNKVYGDSVNAVPIKELPTRYDFDGSFSGKGINESFSIDAGHWTPYGCSKLTGELYVREWGGVANRFSCMYGPHQHGIIDQGWVSYFIQQKLLGRTITIFGDGKQVRDLLHIHDVVSLLTLQGEKLLSGDLSLRGQSFSIGGGFRNTVSLLELCEMLDIKPQFGPWRPADQKVFYADTAKARDLLGWEPRVDFRRGIEELEAWTREHLDVPQRTVREVVS